MYVYIYIYIYVYVYIAFDQGAEFPFSGKHRSGLWPR